MWIGDEKLHCVDKWESDPFQIDHKPNWDNGNQKPKEDKEEIQGLSQWIDIELHIETVGERDVECQGLKLDEATRNRLKEEEILHYTYTSYCLL